MSHIPCCEDPRNIGLQQKWHTLSRPSLGTFPRWRKIRSRQNKALFIPLHLCSQPIRARHGTNKDEECACWHRLLLSSIAVCQRERLQICLSVSFNYRGARAYDNILCLLDLINEVL